MPSAKKQSSRDISCVPTAKTQRTAVNLAISTGKQMPVVNPIGVRVAIQPYSSRISAPCSVDEIKPSTKKHVPLTVKTCDSSAISTIVPMISSDSRNGKPPAVEPMLPCDDEHYAERHWRLTTAHKTLFSLSIIAASLLSRPCSLITSANWAK